MNEPTVFKARPSLGWLWLVAIGLLVLFPIVMTVLNVPGTAWDPMLILILLVELVIAVIFLGLAVLFPTIRYELKSDELALRYGPWTLYRIPYTSINKVSRQNLSVSLWSSMRLPGFAMFKVLYSDVGTVKMCATASATGILLIKAGNELYGITPAEEQAFLSALMARVKR